MPAPERPLSSAPAPTATPPGKARGIAAEQSRAASAGRALGLPTGERLVVKDVITDADGSVHVRYDRIFDGLRVIGGDLVSHRDGSGKIKNVSWNGSHKVAIASTKPKLTLASARTAGAKKAALAQVTTAATKAELVVYSPGGSTRATPTLAFDVLTTGVRPDQTPSRLHTLVDARTGTTLTSWDEIHEGTGNGLYVGAVGIGTTAGPPFTLRDSHNNVTTDLHGVVDNSGTIPGAIFTDTDDRWGNGTVSDRASAGVAAHYGAGKAFDFYTSVLGRRGIWNNGVGARSRVHFGDRYVNAFWDGTQLTYGDGAGNTHPLVELDIVAHEMSHGVTENTADLVFEGEAGGLNEATSDIFGTSVEWYANNPADNPDFLLGELVDINGNGTPLRYMDRPSRDGVSADCWSANLGGLDPHLSSGPLNHWFYLASQGSGARVTNGVSYNSPTCNASTVTPVGRDKAAKIWYRTLTTYLTSGSDYAAARDGAIESAKDLYGDGSAECARTAAAFSAIRVPAGAAVCGSPVPRPLGGNLLRNPGFESGDIRWSATPMVVTQEGTPGSGQMSAWLGGYGEAHTDSISQLVTIPAGRRAILSYYARVSTAERSGAPARDTMKVRAGSTVLQTLSNRNAASRYRLRTIDLSAYAGQTIRLSFTGVENAAAATSFQLDDISLTSGITRLSDFNRDGLTDLVARDAGGRLWLYPSTGGSSLRARVKMGARWGGMTAIVTPGDVTGDGNADLIARDRAGVLWLYPGNGASGLRHRRQIGNGWAGYTITNAANLNGAGRPDLLARDSAGVLWLYPLSGNGLLGRRTRIGAGWQGYSIRSPGDFSGDGRADILARHAAGSLWLYRVNRAGVPSARTLVSRGWAGMTALVTPGNWNRAEGNDLLARDAAGRLWLYPGSNTGRFRPRTLIGSGGWQAMNFLG